MNEPPDSGGPTYQALTAVIIESGSTEPQHPRGVGPMLIDSIRMSEQIRGENETSQPLVIALPLQARPTVLMVPTESPSQ